MPGRRGNTMNNTVGTVARALSVLRAVVEAEGSAGVKDVAVALDLPMSTSHRLLDLLLDAGFVEKEKVQRRYKVGPEFFRLASLVTQKTSLASRLQPVLDELTRQTGETAIFAPFLPAELKTTYAAKSNSPNSLRFRITLFQKMPLEWGATGLAILAFLPEEVQAKVFAQTRPSPVTKKRLTRTAFFERLAAVRREGFAITESEKLADSVGIAAPIYTAPDALVGSIALAIPKVRFSRAKTKIYADLVRRAADRFSSGMRTTPHGPRSS